MNELRIGQRIRVIRRKLESGVPAREARSVVDTITDGTIVAMARLKGSPNTILVSYSDGQVLHTAYVEIYMTGLCLNDHNRSQTIEILEQPPEQLAQASVEKPSASRQGDLFQEVA